MLPAITLVSSRARYLARRCTTAVVVDGLDEIAALVAARAGVTPSTLDLIGHSTRGTHYLRLGRDAIDLLDHRIGRLLAPLPAVLDRAGVVQVRLLGCSTAIGDAAQLTLRRLAAQLGRPVLGTTRALLAAHLDPTGFRDGRPGLLVAVCPPPRPISRRQETSHEASIHPQAHRA